MLGDIRCFFRTVRKYPFPFALSVAILGSAMGATVAVYALLNALVLHPFPIRDDARVVSLVGLSLEPPGQDPVAWWGQAHSLQHLALYSRGEVSLRGSSARQWIRVAAVSSEFFQVFGVQLTRGRDFSSQDDAEGNHIAILSYAFWTANFNRLPSALRARLHLNDKVYEVVGIAPQGLDYPVGTDVWLLRQHDPNKLLALSHNSSSKGLPGPAVGWIGRLRRGASIAGARNELTVLMNRLNRDYSGKTHMSYGDFVGVSELRNQFGAAFRRSLSALLAGALLILLLAEANYSLLLLKWTLLRRREFAVRRVFGASRARVIRRLLTEASALSLLSGLLGLIIAKSLLAAGQAAFPAYLLHLRDRVLFEPPVFGALCLVIALGALPGALAASGLLSGDLASRLRDQAGSLADAPGRTARRILIVLEVLVAFVLSVAATLSLRTSLKLTGAEKGYSVAGLYTLHLSFGELSLPPPALLAKETEIIEAAKGLPGVTAVGAADSLPIWPPSKGFFVKHGSEETWCPTTLVAGDYFRVFGIRLLSGRPLSGHNGSEVVLSELAAKEFGPAGGAVGRSVLVGDETKPREVVGVAANTRGVAVVERPAPRIYLPLSEPVSNPRAGVGMYLVIHCQHGCGDLVRSALGRLKRAGADSYVDQATPLARLAERVIAPARARGALLSSYALFGFTLALAGVFMLVSYVSAARRSEVGLRLALGAEPREVAFLLAREGVALATIGLIGGAVASLYAMQLMRNLLFGVGVIDPVSFAVAGMIILVGATTASVLPAISAVRRQDPASLLKVT